jgi:hypothetical protein
MTTPSAPLDPQLRRIARRVGRTLNAGVYLERAAAATAIIACAAATVWVGMKALAPAIHLWALWGLAALPLAWLGVALFCWKKGLYFSEYECLALADARALGDGSLVSAAELPDYGRSSAGALSTLENADAPPARLEPSVYAKKIALPAVYLGLVALAPLGALSDIPPATTVMDRELEELAQLLEEEILENDRGAELKQQIAEIKEESRAISQEQWEALETMRAKTAAAFENQANKAAELQRELDKFEEAAREAAGEGQEEKSDEQIADELEKAAESLLNALQNNKTSSKELSEAMQKAKKEAEKLRKECQNCKNGGAKKDGDGKGGESKSGGGSSSEEGEGSESKDGKSGEGKEGKEGKSGQDGKKNGPQKPNAEALKKKLEDLKQKLSERQKQCEAKAGQCSGGNGPGNGGTNRGRGDAPLTFSDKPREIDAQMEMELLEMQYLDENSDLVIDITQREPPKEGLEETGGQSVGWAGIAGAGGDASATFISPSQKDVVQRYFQSRQ